MFRQSSIICVSFIKANLLKYKKRQLKIAYERYYSAVKTYQVKHVLIRITLKKKCNNFFDDKTLKPSYLKTK